MQTNLTIISTWHWGVAANAGAAEILRQGGSALDAVEAGVRVAEDDPAVTTVGYGGMPDRTGRITLDASIMDHQGNAGGVAFLEGFKNPISVARKVMEKTPHVLLVGAGARKFALQQGFKKLDLHTPATKKAIEDWKTFLPPAQSHTLDEEQAAWLEWKKHTTTPAKEPTHDTISMLALDLHGHLAGACTTSGLEFKMHGRVGDSPILGAGLYVDGNRSAAAATGDGELSIKICGSFLVTELMRNGLPPQDACRAACERVVERVNNHQGLQIAFIALRQDGAVGACSLRQGFQYALTQGDRTVLHDCRPYIDESASDSANHPS